jgi:hypothetical protein
MKEIGSRRIRDRYSLFFTEIARFPEFPNGGSWEFRVSHNNVDIEIQVVNSKRTFQFDRSPTTYNISKISQKAHYTQNTYTSWIEK